MSRTIDGHVYDFAAECFTCGAFAVFQDKTERREWADAKHPGHQLDFHLQARV